jgi:uncharacterized protein YukE
MADGTAGGFFGRPPSLQGLGRAAGDSVNELERLRGTLNGGVQALLPAWTGPAATRFDSHSQQLLGATGTTGHLANQFAASLRVLEGMLGAARAKFEAAEALARANRLEITPGLRVVACDVEGAKMVLAVQAQVDLAAAMAEEARNEARIANDAVAQGVRTVAEILSNLIGPGGKIKAGGAVLGVAKWPMRWMYKAGPAYGRDFGNALTRLLRGMEGKPSPLGNGWVMTRVERRIGLGEKRVDILHVNEAEKKIVIEDVFTGAKEDAAHALKTQDYMAAFRKEIGEGWDVQAWTSFNHPSRMH